MVSVPCHSNPSFSEQVDRRMVADLNLLSEFVFWSSLIFSLDMTVYIVVFFYRWLWYSDFTENKQNTNLLNATYLEITFLWSLACLPFSSPYKEN